MASLARPRYPDRYLGRGSPRRQVMVSLRRQLGAPYGDASATAGCSDLEEYYEDMPVLQYSETEDVLSEDDSEDEEGTGFWGSFTPAVSARVLNHIMLMVLSLALCFRRQLEPRLGGLWLVRLTPSQ